MLKLRRDFSTASCRSMDGLSCLFSNDGGPETFLAKRVQMCDFELGKHSVQMC